MTVCSQCGMYVGRNEYHPEAACLMYKACESSAKVRKQLRLLQTHFILEAAPKCKTCAGFIDRVKDQPYDEDLTSYAEINGSY